MPEFDSFDALRSDPLDDALPVEIPVAGQIRTFPWRLDGRSTHVLQERHDTDISEVLEAVDTLVQSKVDPDVLAEHGIDSMEDLDDLPEEKREEIAEEVVSDAQIDVGDALDAFAKLLHAGFVRFQPDVTLDEVRGILRPKTAAHVPFQQMLRRVATQKDDALPESSGKGKSSAPTS
jgi:hypothetical protein